MLKRDKHVFFFKIILLFIIALIIPFLIGEINSRIYKHNSDSVIEIEKAYFYNSDIDLLSDYSPIELQKKLLNLPWKEYKLPNIPVENISHVLWVKIRIPDVQIHGASLYIHRIDQNYEIYFDGALIEKFGEISENPGFYGSPNHFIDILPSMRGKNLYFRIASSNVTTGIITPVRYASQQNLINVKLNLNYQTVGIAVTFFMFGVFSFVFFKVYKTDKSYLYFGFLSISLAIFIIIRNRIPYTLTDNYVLLYYFHCISLYVFTAALGLYLDSMFGSGYKKFLRRIWQSFIILVFFMVLASIVGVISIDKTITVYNYLMLPIIAIYIGVILYKSFKNDDEARIIGFGFLLMSILSAADIIADLNSLPFPYEALSTGFVYIILAICIVMVRRMLKIRLDLEKNNKELKIKMFEVEEANKRISFSEEKYRILINNLQDIIFTMDENCQIISANSKFNKISEETDFSKGVNLCDLIYFQEDESGISRAIVNKKIEDFIESKRPIDMRLLFKSTVTGEPIDCTLSLTMVDSDDLGNPNKSIIGKIAFNIEDRLVEYFCEEQGHYKMGNYILLCDDITHRITRNLVKYISDSQLNMIRVALREAIMNAVEHGNLNISFEEKTQYMMQEKYSELLFERNADPKYKDRSVDIRYSINSEYIEYRIKDCGDGFNVDKMHNTKPDEINGNNLTHGRGMMMIKNIFDEVEYISPGNEVVLKKKINL